MHSFLSIQLKTLKFKKKNDYKYKTSKLILKFYLTFEGVTFLKSLFEFDSKIYVRICWELGVCDRANMSANFYTCFEFCDVA